MRMELGGVYLVAFYLKERMRTRSVGMECSCVRVVVAHDIERLVEIRPPFFHVVDMTFLHRHHGLCRMEPARMPVCRLVDILHALMI